MFGDLSKLLNDKNFRRVVFVFFIYKIFVISIAVGTQFFVPAGITHTEKVTDNIFLNPFAQYDATAYLDIAKNGYRHDFGTYEAGDYHWYPLYPFLIRVFSFIGYPLAAFLISNVMSFLAITFLYLLVKEELGKKHAYKTAVYMMFFPTAFYFTTMYTESLFLFLSVSIFYFAKKGNWPLVGLLGFLVALTRMQGMLLFIPVVYIYMRSIKFDFKKIKKDVIYITGMPIGVLTFMFYEYMITGDFLIQFKSALVFGKQLSFPWTGFIFSIKAIFADTSFINVSYHVYTLLMTAFFIALLCISYKKLRPEYTIYFALSLLVILISSNLFGATRYFLMVFPAFMVLSLYNNKNNYIKYGIILAYIFFIIIMSGSIVLHATERISTPLFYTPLF